MKADEMLLLPYGIPPKATEIAATEKLKEAFERHMTHESEFLRSYGDAVGRLGPPLVKFILGLILSDEDKHHGVMQSIVSRLDADLRWRHDPQALPTSNAPMADRQALLTLTDLFLAEEKQGLEQAKRLISETEGFYNGLLAMLVHMMVHDSEKHIMMLQFLRKQLTQSV